VVAERRWAISVCIGCLVKIVDAARKITVWIDKHEHPQARFADRQRPIFFYRCATLTRSKA
jgi:hypothetical protein